MSQFDELPEGWTEVRLEEVAEKVGSGATPRGGSKSYQQSGVPLIRSMNVHFDGLREEGLVYLDDKQAEGLKNVEVKPNDVLLNITGASIGRVTQAPFNLDGARVNQHVCIIRPTDNFDPAFLTKYLASPKVQKIITAEEYGMTRQALTKQMILDFEVPLPPLNEQRRIVEKIEALTDRSRKARAALDQIPALLDQFRQSVLAAAFRGDLTADWRAQNPNVEPAETRWGIVKPTCQNELLPELPENWGYRELESFSERVSVGHVGSTSEFYCNADEGVPFIRSQNVRPARLDLQEVKSITREFHKKLKKSQLKAGDLLIVRVGANRGDTCFLPPGLGEINCANVVFARPFPGISQYLELFFQSELCQKELLNLTTGSAQGVINTKSVAKVLVPIPPIEEQSEILKKIWESFAFIKTIEDLLGQIDEEAKLMDQSILAKAFRGELVPQDPNDEPAAVLLDRIRAERERLGSGKKRSKAKK